MYDKLGYQVRQVATRTNALALTIVTLVGNDIVGVSHGPHGSFSVSRCYKCHMFSTCRPGDVLIGQTRYLFFKFGKRIRKYTFRFYPDSVA